MGLFSLPSDLWCIRLPIFRQSRMHRAYGLFWSKRWFTELFACRVWIIRQKWNIRKTIINFKCHPTYQSKALFYSSTRDSRLNIALCQGFSGQNNRTMNWTPKLVLEKAPLLNGDSPFPSCEMTARLSSNWTASTSIKSSDKYYTEISLKYLPLTKHIQTAQLLHTYI